MAAERCQVPLPLTVVHCEELWGQSLTKQITGGAPKRTRALASTSQAPARWSCHMSRVEESHAANLTRSGLCTKIPAACIDCKQAI